MAVRERQAPALDSALRPGDRGQQWSLASLIPCRIHGELLGGRRRWFEGSSWFMSKYKRRWSAERSAASIEWYLDRPNAEGALAAEASLAPRAADLAIEVMEEQYKELAAWVAATMEAAEAE